MPANPFLGQIAMLASNFAPRGWALCDGQLLPITQNTSLYSLLGTTYGGDGRSTFALPDLRGRTLISQGEGPGLPRYPWGRKDSFEDVARYEPGSGKETTQVPYLAINYIIALEGIFPARN